ncbi:MAG: DUF808 family protein [Campylobacterales bacterium]|nr:DUF808 family protein [Campylobacterales bacterium]
MAGILGYLAALADDISSLASKTMVTASKSMATSLDDMTLMLDDIATYTKVASVKSSGVVIDDLAAISSMTNETTSDILKKELQNAHSLSEFKSHIAKLPSDEQQKLFEEVSAMREAVLVELKRNAAKRELPIVWKIAKGSAKNKLIIIPLILIVSAFVPWLMSPILIAGGLYLAYEGTESVIERFWHREEEHASAQETIAELSVEHFESQRVASAIKTDFILSLEIMVLALSLVSDAGFGVKMSVLFAVALIATVGVYGIVAVIIKLDDIGFFLQKSKLTLLKRMGDGLVVSVPWLIGGIGVIGTVAMLAVGGGILDHQLGILHRIEEVLEDFGLAWLVIFILQMCIGMVSGLIVIKAVQVISPWITQFKRRFSKS